GGDDAPQYRARQRGSSPQDRHSRGTVSRRAPKQQPGLFRADREHRRPGAGPGLLARNLRDPAGGRRSKRSENPYKPELTPVNAARGTSRDRRRNDRVRDSVKAWTVSLRCAAVSETQETAALRNFQPGYVGLGSLAPNRLARDAGGMSALVRKRRFAIK